MDYDWTSRLQRLLLRGPGPLAKAGSAAWSSLSVCTLITLGPMTAVMVALYAAEKAMWRDYDRIQPPTHQSREIVTPNAPDA